MSKFIVSCARHLSVSVHQRLFYRWYLQFRQFCPLDITRSKIWLQLFSFLSLRQKIQNFLVPFARQQGASVQFTPPVLFYFVQNFDSIQCVNARSSLQPMYKRRAKEISAVRKTISTWTLVTPCDLFTPSSCYNANLNGIKLKKKCDCCVKFSEQNKLLWETICQQTIYPLRLCKNSWWSSTQTTETTNHSFFWQEVVANDMFKWKLNGTFPKFSCGAVASKKLFEWKQSWGRQIVTL